MATTTGAIGVPRRRTDGEGKVRGSTRYAADLPVTGLLHALEGALQRPARVLNDADMQGLEVVQGQGVEVVITLGTGFGSAFLAAILYSIISWALSTLLLKNDGNP